MVIYLLVCALLFTGGLVIERKILENELHPVLIIAHLFLWFTPGINLVALYMALYHIHGYWERNS